MKALMVVGTTSNAGKSILTTALCRILFRKGWRVAPFKGQNMALNAYVTTTGGEMGYAQAVQAWAAGTNPWVEMNPILLKPQGDKTSQVIIRGKVVGSVGAKEYYEKYFDRCWENITQSINHLRGEFDFLVCEGAGSPAEINLKERDLTNMRVACYLNAPTILVVDIDRGGAFAHVVGTLALLEPEEKQLIKGIVINKFRGQLDILQPGIEWLEDYTKIPVLGVIPWCNQLFPSEDSLNLLDRPSQKANQELTIAVIRLPHISNFTDFEPLEAEPTVGLKYVPLEGHLGYPDAVIIPGTKTTVMDLQALNESGMRAKIEDYALGGGIVFGICGGFQMLGKSVSDPDGIEGIVSQAAGLDLLPTKTTLTKRKVVRQLRCTSNYPYTSLSIEGYEIHQGRTYLLDPQKNNKNSRVCLPLFDQPDLGIVDESLSLWGCYLHGLFDNGPWRRAWLNHLRQRRGLISLPTGVPNYREQREAVLDTIATLVESNLDLKPILPNH